jgi:hypothetical protein
MRDEIERLFKEHQTEVLRERRALQRQSLVRPVVIHAGLRPDQQVEAFSRDLTHEGMGVVSKVAWEVGRVATLEIHSLFGAPVRVRAAVRWCVAYGKGWHLTGWHFLELG